MRSSVSGFHVLRDEPATGSHVAGELMVLRRVARSGMRAIDAGANRGVTALAIAEEIGEQGWLFAFEPIPDTYAELERNLKANGVENASAYRLALSDRRLPLPFYKRGEGSRLVPGGHVEDLWVEATTIDDFVTECRLGRVDLLNLDCEGSELLVLKGAEALLIEQCPQILFELHHAFLEQLGQSADDVIGFLKAIGYVLQPLRVENLKVETSFERCSHIYAWKPTAHEGLRLEE